MLFTTPHRTCSVRCIPSYQNYQQAKNTVWNIPEPPSSRGTPHNVTNLVDWVPYDYVADSIDLQEQLVRQNNEPSTITNMGSTTDKFYQYVDNDLNKTIQRTMQKPRSLSYRNKLSSREKMTSGQDAVARSQRRTQVHKVQSSMARRVNPFSNLTSRLKNRIQKIEPNKYFFSSNLQFREHTQQFVSKKQSSQVINSSAK